MICLIPENDKLWGGRPCTYRQWAVESAKAYGNEVVVLHCEGDVPGLAEFRSIYKHNSPNGEAFERWCFEQWFYIADWMEKTGTDDVFKADSDVLVFDRLTSWHCDNNVAAGEITGSIPACNCFIGRKTARSSVDYLLSVFRRGVQSKDMWQSELVSDQSLLHVLWNVMEFPDLCNNDPNRASFDQNVYLVPDGWPSHQGHKDVVFIQGVPYQATPQGARRLYNLHCWGKAKGQMQNIWRQSRASLTQGPVRMEIL